MLTKLVPEFNFFDEDHPIYTKPQTLPAAKVNECTMSEVLLSSGAIVSNSHLKTCVLGERSIVREGSYLENVLMMGADYYEESQSMQATDIPALGIGKNCSIKNSIIDRNARIGDGCILSPDGKLDRIDYGRDIYVRDGVLCIGANAVLPANTVF